MAMAMAVRARLVPTLVPPAMASRSARNRDAGSFPASLLRSRRELSHAWWAGTCQLAVCYAALASLAGSVSATSSEYLIGVGSYDVTGPAADVNMMGYANPAQIAAGIHMRLRARAFIVASPLAKTSVQADSTVVFVNLDACMGEQAVTTEVVRRLRTRYGDLYTEKNIIISGIHTHSGPGGYLQYAVYLITSWGFVRQSFEALVAGIVEAIVEAHESLQPGSIYIKEGELLDANINRSPSAYLNNPEEERSQYPHDVDKEMTLLKFLDSEGDPLGVLNFFPVHGVSMNRTNGLISGDNKGAASRFMEDWLDGYLGRGVAGEEADLVGVSNDMGGDGLGETSQTEQDDDFDIVKGLHVSPRFSSPGGQPSSPAGSRLHRVRTQRRSVRGGKPFAVAAFATSNEGDVSPNVGGPFCIDTGEPCDFYASTCGGSVEKCIGRGPAWPEDDFASTRMIADRQYQKARQLFLSAQESLAGSVGHRQTHLLMSDLEVQLPPSSPGGEPTLVHTCPAALGFSFAAGTTDGPGAFNFKQGDNKGNPFWRIIGGFLKSPSAAQVECQKPKPILLDTGEMSLPYPWAAAILPISIHKIGSLVILGVPGELSTMAGRRLRTAVKAALQESSPEQFGNSTRVVIAGLANAYSQYITTYEEYQIQRYEGASTLYGPHTLSAYIQEFQKLAVALALGRKVPDGPSPPNLLSRQIGFLPPVVADAVPRGVKFGDVVRDIAPNTTVANGDTVEAVFWSACPRNDLHTEGTFAVVERLDVASGEWVPKYDDDDWCLKFRWRRPSKLSRYSVATVTWEIPQPAAGGVYRLRHFGAHKRFLGKVEHFWGASTAFTLRKRC